MRFPRTHLVLVALLGLGLASFVVAKFQDDATEDRFSTDSILEEIPGEPLSGPLAAPVEEDAETGALPVVADLLPPPEPAPLLEEKVHEVRSGDSLARIFSGLEIPARELKLLERTEPYGKRLHDIFPGHTFTFTVNGNNEIIKLTYSPGPLETLAFERAGDGFIGREVQREPDIQTAYKHASIDQSLFLASQKSGLDDSLTMRLAQIFQWDIDFVLDIRKGDEFYVLFEERYLDNEFIGYGEILAAEFINQSKPYRAVRYIDETGRSGYFNPDGRNMRKAFLRAPVEFSRISSNFNLRRKHPLYKRTMPHRGIDYAAPTGTPILAAGDGRVQSAAKNNANGNYVVLQHGEQFTTKYLHLSRFARGVRKGSKVEQGQIIGYVGSTGWATGPHLHYEFLVNGVHMNPRTVKLPDAKPIGERELTRFSSDTAPMFTLLDDYKQQIQLALLAD
ncbi:MAG: peptidoglycan DD-metalloendopeptidase family protein [Pseudomonadota bacterium]